MIPVIPEAETENQYQPEPSFLAGVDSSCMGPRPAAEHAAQGFKPGEISLLRNIVAYPDQDFQKNSHEQKRAAIIVQHLGRLQVPGDGPVAENRYQKNPPQEHAQAGDGHSHEQQGRVPVQNPLPQGIAFNPDAGPRLFQFVLAHKEIEQAHGRQRQGQNPLGKGHDQAVSNLAPVLAAVLDQDRMAFRGRRHETGDSLPDNPPEIGMGVAHIRT